MTFSKVMIVLYSMFESVLLMPRLRPFRDMFGGYICLCYFLRYLICIMEVSTPTEDCLVLIHDLLCPIVEARDENSLNRQEVKTGRSPLSI